MAKRWFERRWNESRGDEHHHWGPATYFFEVDDQGWPIRQVEVYDQGPTLRYGPQHPEDEYGFLGQASVYADDEDWSPWSITSEAFEEAWAAAQ